MHKWIYYLNIMAEVRIEVCGLKSLITCGVLFLLQHFCYWITSVVLLGKILFILHFDTFTLLLVIKSNATELHHISLHRHKHLFRSVSAHAAQLFCLSKPLLKIARQMHSSSLSGVS